MRRRLRGRQPAQIALIMPIAVITCIGVLGLVLDIGLFRVIDSEFENAADAAALAAAWYDPVCPGLGDTQLPTDTRCIRADNQPDSAPVIATAVAQANLGLASKLCASQPTIIVQPGQLNTPSAPAVSVIIQCHAPYLAGAVLGLTGGSDITRWASAAIGDEQNGSLSDYNLNDPSPLVAALVAL
jgi:hypothetical protein